MTPQELRNSILQRAIEGKLVEQRAEEGTGEELYKIIQEEKKKSTKEGKIKKQKTLDGIKEEEIPFDIPKNWKWIDLVDICSLIGGYAFKSTSYTKIGVRVIRISDFNEKGLIDKDKKFYKEEKSLSKYLIESNDILMCMTGGTVGKTAFLGEINEKLYLNQRVAAIRVKNNSIIDKDYLYCIINSKYIKNIINEQKNSTNDNISMKLIQQFQIPLPPLAEQKRIADKIEELMPLIDDYEKNWQRLNDLNKKFPEDMKKSLLQEAIKGKLVEQRAEEGTGEELYTLIQKEKKKLIKEGKIKKQKALDEIKEEEIPFDIPKNWKWVRLGEVISFKIGKTPPRSEIQWWKHQIPWVSIADMKENGFIKETKEGISTEALEQKFSNSISQKGTLLMSFKLTVGRVSILNIDAVHNEAIISIYPIIDNEDTFKLFLFKILPLVSQSGDKKNAIKGKTLNSVSINNLLIPLPPLLEQKRIVEKLEELLPLCDELVSKEK